MKLAHHAMTWEGWWRNHDQPLDAAQLLDEVSAAGYAGVEVSPDPGWGDPAGFARAIRDHGLQIAALACAVTAVPYEPNAEEFRQAVDAAEAMGIDTLMVCGGFLGNKRRVNFESDYGAFAGVLKSSCAVAGERGLTVAYHPHLGCLIETTEQARRLLDEGLDRVDNFALCLDTGHLAAAGSDPLDFIDCFGERIAHVHLKDWYDQPGAGQFVELGTGNAGLDFRAITTALDAKGYTGWYVVETDRCAGTPAESAAQSRRHLAALELVTA